MGAAAEKFVFQDRFYQIDAADALYKSLKDDPENNPVAALPTGSGKTPTLCRFIDLVLSENPLENVLVLSHEKNILKQNFTTLENYFDGVDIGLYSSSLGSRLIKKITVAGIQSIFRRPEEFKKFGVILVDECHKITIKQGGMYRKFISDLKNPQIAGLTATPFRTGHGWIHMGEGALFNDLCFDMTSEENYNLLVENGYLSEMFGKPTSLKMDPEKAKVRKLGDDYNQKQMSTAFNRDEITEAAVIESIHYGKKYKKWLCFAIDIDHAENIKKYFIKHGISAAVVHSKMEDSDERIIREYKEGKYQVLINVDMLTTGFDVPEIDLVLLMRPTQSPVLHIQMIGRGARIVYAKGFNLNKKKGRLKAIKKGPKQHCLVLDFAGNVQRLGPINRVEVKQKDPTKGTGDAITKVCPECDIINHGSAKFCCNCDHEFEIKEKLKSTHSGDDVVAKGKKVEVPSGEKSWAQVDSISYSRYKSKIGTPDQILVKYKCGLTTIKEYVSIEHNGYAKHRAKHWIDFRWSGQDGEQPRTINDFFSDSHMIKKPVSIYVDMRGKFPEILDATF